MSTRPYSRPMKFLGLVIVVGLLLFAVELFLYNLGILSNEKVRLASDALLTTLTAVYVVLTGLILSETTRQTEQEIQPTFAVQIKANGVEVTNVGNGPALDTVISLTLVSANEGKVEVVTVADQDIPSDGSVPFATGPFAEFGRKVSDGEEFESLKLEGEYTDQHQNRRQIETRNYDLSEYSDRVFHPDTKSTIRRRFNQQ